MSELVIPDDYPPSFNIAINPYDLRGHGEVKKATDDLRRLCNEAERRGYSFCSEVYPMDDNHYYRFWKLGHNPTPIKP